MKRFVCFLLSAILLIGLLPTRVFAATTVSSYSDLQNAINLAPTGVSTTIILTGNITATGAAINIGHDQNIVLTSTAGSTFTFTQTNANQRHFNVSGSLTLQNITLAGPGGSAAGGVFLSNGNLTMETGSTITGAVVSGNGGGVAVTNNSTLTMNGGTISNNTAIGMGGGVFAEAGSLVTVNNGLITRNTATVSGGGVQISNGATFNFSQGSITYNSATASNSVGGGVSMTSGYVNINGGLISGNRAFQGGGFYVDSGSMLTTTAGTISNNTAGSDGGGVFSAGYAYADPLWGGAYWNLVIGANTVFSGNMAGNGARIPPGNVVETTQIRTTSSSFYNSPVNNLDINFYGEGVMITAFLVTFDAGGHGSFSPGSVTSQSIPITNNPRVLSSVPSTVARGGYGFRGWSSDGGTTILSPYGVLATSVNSNITYVAQYYSPISLTFDAQGGTFSSQGGAATQTVSNVQVNGTYAAPFSQVTNPTRPGYEFRGWFTTVEGGGGVQILSTTIVTTTANQTLYAYWAPNPTVTIIFDSQGGTPAAQTVANRVSGSTYDATLKAVITPVRPEYVFVGWFTAQTGGTQITASSIIPGSSTTVYAQWIETPTITLTFNSQGGTFDGQQRQLQTDDPYAEAMGSILVPTRKGFAFEGWYTAPDGDASSVQILPTAIVTTSSDQTLYAHWNEVTVTVTFNAQGGTPATQVAPGQIGLSSYASLLSSITTPTYHGYTFVGWFNAAAGGTQITSGSTIPTVDTTVYAQWSPMTPYTITFDPQGGVITGTAVFTPVYEGDTFAAAISAAEVPTPPAGDFFAGWYTAPTGGTPVLPSTIVTSSITVYAHWIATQTVNVTFDGNGGSPASQLLGGIAPLNMITVNQIQTPTRPGYTFTGWDTSPSSGTVLTLPFMSPSSNTTYYAQWNPIPAVTVTFDAQGGTPASQTETVQPGSTYASAFNALEEPSKSGYIFIGWYTVPDGSSGGSPIFATTIVPDLPQTTLYAHWLVDPTTTTTFDAQGGTPTYQYVINRGLGRAMEYYATTLQAVTTPTLVDFVFVEWYDPNTGAVVDQFTPLPNPPVNRTLYARWIPIPTITLTFDAQGGAPDGQQVPIKNGHTYGEAFSQISTPDKHGSIFIGWFTMPDGDSSAVQVLDDTIVTSITDLTLYAHWMTTLVNVSFDAQGGDPPLQTVTGKIPGDAYFVTLQSVAIPTRRGYTFLGWYTASTGGTEITSADLVPANDTTLYAQWEPIHITIYFDAQGAMPDMQNGPAVTWGTYESAFASITTPTMADGTFVGWFTQIIGGTEVYSGDIVSVTSDQTLYARFLPRAAIPSLPGVLPPSDDTAQQDSTGDSSADYRGTVTLTHYHQAFFIGGDDGLISPNALITRAQVASVLMRIISDTTRVNYWTRYNPFPDVLNNGGAWYSNAVSVANSTGLMMGFPDGTFRPDSFITRGEMVTIIARLIPHNERPVADGDMFPDISDSWARQSINIAAKMGIAQGFPDGNFNPTENITRAQLATMVNRMMGRTQDDIDKNNMNTWEDNASEDAWYYWAIQIASNSDANAPERDWAALQLPDAPAS